MFHRKDSLLRRGGTLWFQRKNHTSFIPFFGTGIFIFRLFIITTHNMSWLFHFGEWDLSLKVKTTCFVIMIFFFHLNEFFALPKTCNEFTEGKHARETPAEGCCMHTSPCCCFQMLPDARERCDSSTLHIYFASFTSCLYCLLLHHSSFLLFPILSASHA